MRFQFPTGWNSTRYYKQASDCSAVSIPNGMEFYLGLSFQKWDRSVVSIPNGMEFYNAQARTAAKYLEFQFPTGWNSTLFLSKFP